MISKLFCASLLLFVFASSAQTPSKIISLAPHLAEWVFALGAQEYLIAVSESSDYPAEAARLPTIASHSGVNFESILRLQPQLILAWRGGNKHQDLARLESLGFALFYSQPKTLEDIPDEILALANLLGRSEQAQNIVTRFRTKLAQINRSSNKSAQINAFYYMWPKPIMTIGKDAWANQLLTSCGANNIFADSFSEYPQVTMEQVIRKKPQLIIAAMKTTATQVKQHWQDWQPVLDARYVVVNPDLLHRFTPRVLDGLEDLCTKIRQ